VQRIAQYFWQNQAHFRPSPQLTRPQARPTVPERTPLGQEWHSSIGTGSECPPVLLTMAAYRGTLAAVRALGRAGIPVTVADPAWLAASKWSRFATTTETCPDVTDSDRFVDWLVTFGRTRPRHVLLPTSDEIAWLCSKHRERLVEHFDLDIPAIAVTHRILNKRALYGAAVAAGMSVPPTWFPGAVDDLGQCLHEATFPVIVKPRTQVMFRSQSKGVLVERASDLPARYAAFARQPYGNAVIAHDPDCALPMVQEFLPQAATRIYNISAFVHRHRIVGALASRKLLQQPRRLGTGICFEEAPISAELVQRLQALVTRVGFDGVFEAEFVESGRDRVLIDFNPRFYNQMAFDMDRGLPLALLAYHASKGDDSEVATLYSRLCLRPPMGRVYVDFLNLRLLLLAQRVAGTLSGTEKGAWVEWLKVNRSQTTYAELDKSDFAPACAAALQLLLTHARHPRKFLYAMVLNRS
jgi:D-aspartate ligase